jgi:hypothetical protein
MGLFSQFSISSATERSRRHTVCRLDQEELAPIEATLAAPRLARRRVHRRERWWTRRPPSEDGKAEALSADRDVFAKRTQLSLPRVNVLKATSNSVGVKFIVREVRSVNSSD